MLHPGYVQTLCFPHPCYQYSLCVNFSVALAFHYFFSQLFLEQIIILVKCQILFFLADTRSWGKRYSIPTTLFKHCRGIIGTLNKTSLVGILSEVTAIRDAKSVR